MGGDSTAHQAARAFCDAWRDQGGFVIRQSRDGTLLLDTTHEDGGGTVRLTEPQLRTVLAENARMREELEWLRTVRTCGSTAVLPNGDEHVCVLPFGHGPEHRDGDGIRWQVYDAPPESDDALKTLLRSQGLTLPVSQQPWFNAESARQQPARDTANGDGGAQ